MDPSNNTGSGGSATMTASGQVRRRRSVPFKFLVPLVYAPALPLVRIAFKKQPVLRQRLFFGLIGAAIMHGTYLLMFDLSLDSSAEATRSGLPPPPSGLPDIYHQNQQPATASSSSSSTQQQS
ncbi:hypothetical protein PTSG_07325 [Salpingoeca rosetta]|uniref:Uncharacterized protein n=1 Tax=Salpingoeca rosetta (strain ATCC 50818 / BSB-021) TaxID=946362 RepID=F2UJ34_SALR5|nr:uncharacterized protein PTSG_07325 [Salpingoeca rosetta]EGD76982.1 hypothetical protein PTSG_07325 [Salpingoeca rosetta]|eukprot:XP_004990822.1 hypothetical protein PTSG_07325 [Salpingoeca rosetta]